jgi:uncharacterized protein
MFPLNDGGAISGLVCGVLFGYVLENAGFGSPCKLTAQFRLTDWSVFKVMFTAIALFVPTSLVVASAVGGALVGSGFAVGGYCPGTSVVGLFSGRLDALVFIIGLVLGTFVFAGLYGPAIEALMAAGEVQTGDTISDAYGIPQVAVIAILVVALVAVFYAGAWFERRGKGPVTAEQAVAGADAADASTT